MLTEDYSVEDYVSLIENFMIDKERKLQLIGFVNEVVNASNYDARTSLSESVEACELICLKYKITETIEKCFIYYLGGIIFIADEYHASARSKLMGLLKKAMEKSLKEEENDEEE